MPWFVPRPQQLVIYCHCATHSMPPSNQINANKMQRQCSRLMRENLILISVPPVSVQWNVSKYLLLFFSLVGTKRMALAERWMDNMNCALKLIEIIYLFTKWKWTENQIVVVGMRRFGRISYFLENLMDRPAPRFHFNYANGTDSHGHIFSTKNRIKTNWFEFGYKWRRVNAIFSICKIRSNVNIRFGRRRRPLLYDSNQWDVEQPLNTHFCQSSLTWRTIRNRVSENNLNECSSSSNVSCGN